MNSYYEQHKEELSKKLREYNQRPEVKEKRRARERLTKRSVRKTLKEHEELLKHDNERLKLFCEKGKVIMVTEEKI